MEEQEIIDELYLLCRLCIVGDGKFAILPDTQIPRAIHEIYGVKIESYDGLSQLLCVKCRNKLLKVLNRRATYVTNQEILQSLKKSHISGKALTSVTECLKDSNVQIKEEPADLPDTEEMDVDDAFDGQIEEESTCAEVQTTENVPQSTPVDVGPLQKQDKVQEPCAMFEYRYYCRLCTENFESVFTLRDHTKSHTKLMLLQRRYTPYTCSVKVPRVMSEDDSDVAITSIHNEHHPLFFMKLHEVHTGKIKVAKEDDCVSPNIIHRNSSASEESGQNIIRGIEDIKPFPSVIHRNSSTLEENEKGVRIEIKVENSVFKPSFAYLPTQFHSDLGSILRQTNLVLENEYSTSPTTFQVPYTRIDNVITKCITKFEEENLIKQLEVVHLLLWQLCKKGVRINWKEVPSEVIPQVILKHMAVTKSQASDLLVGYTPLMSKDSSKKSTINDTQQMTPLKNLVPIKGVAKKSTTKNSKAPQKKESKRGAEANTPTNTPSEERPSSPDDTAHGDTHRYDDPYDASDDTSNSEQHPAPMLPIIVSATSLSASAMATSDSTSVYIDLEDSKNTLASDQFPEPLSPCDFFKHVLLNQQIYLSTESISEHATRLACFKKTVEGSGDYCVTVANEDNIFYLEVCKGKQITDISQENAVTQWALLSSLTQKRVETIMSNYAKRCSIDTNIVDKFLKIVRSISGTILDDRVNLESPKNFFF